MKKFIVKISIIKLAILLTLIVILASCGGPRYGCPAQYGFGPGRMR